MTCKPVAATASVLSLVLVLGCFIELRQSNLTAHPQHALESWGHSFSRRLTSTSDASDKASQLFWKQVNQAYVSGSGKQLLAPLSPFMKALQKEQQREKTSPKPPRPSPPPQSSATSTGGTITIQREHGVRLYMLFSHHVYITRTRILYSKLGSLESGLWREVAGSTSRFAVASASAWLSCA